MSNEMGNCKLCGDEALVQVGEDQTPLCLQHFDRFLHAMKTLVEIAEQKGE